jgi:hypothetical protein
VKAIINRKRYDTDAPFTTLVASWNSGHNYGDFCRVDESLYRTGKGSWFILGEGGPATVYRRPSGSSGWVGSRKIRPLTPDEACDWLEEHNWPEEIEVWFGAEIGDA